VRLWRRARRTHKLPDADDLRKHRPVGYKNIKLDATSARCNCSNPACCSTSGGIAKGYAGDEAQKVLKKHGITSALRRGRRRYRGERGAARERGLEDRDPNRLDPAEKEKPKYLLLRTRRCPRRAT